MLENRTRMESTKRDVFVLGMLSEEERGGWYPQGYRDLTLEMGFFSQI